MCQHAAFIGLIIAISTSASLSAGEVAEQKAPTGKMESCKALMEQHRASMSASRGADGRLQALVDVIDEAEGQARTDALVAAVKELAAQHRQTRSMMSMETKKQSHMMAHMRDGTKMPACPMMQEMAAQEVAPADSGESDVSEGHEEHHDL
jgi:hypothetical protein